MEYITHSRAETVALGEKMAAVLPAGSLVAFTGGLGAGKTAFCEGLAKGLGCRDPVSSPTFAIVNYYRGPRPLAHFDPVSYTHLKSHNQCRTHGHGCPIIQLFLLCAASRDFPLEDGRIQLQRVIKSHSRYFPVLSLYAQRVYPHST